MELSEASLADSDQIVQLANRSFQTPLNTDDWKWFVLSNPRGQDRQYVVKLTNGDIVACFSFFPTIILLHGIHQQASFAHHLMINEDYRNTKLFIDLSKYAIEKEFSLGVQLLITAPNKASYLPHRMLMGWSDLFELQRFAKAPSNSGLVTEEALQDTSTEGDIERFFGEANRHVEFAFHKDYEWFEWRYLRRPRKPYKILYQYIDGKLLGICILKRWVEPNGYTKLHIIDLIVEDKIALESILRRVDVIGSDCHEINLWSSKLNPMQASLMEFGFVAAAGCTQPVIVRSLQDKDIPVVNASALFVYGDGDLQF